MMGLFIIGLLKLATWVFVCTWLLRFLSVLTYVGAPAVMKLPFHNDGMGLHSIIGRHIYTFTYVVCNLVKQTILYMSLWFL